MRRALLGLYLVGLLALVGASSAISGNATVSTVAWGHAIQVPGTAGETATVNSVSCPKAGTCAAGGQFSRGPYVPTFVIDETNGSWGNATRVRFAVGGNGISYTTSVSCATARNCAAVGEFTDGSHHSRAFVVDERKGRWGTAIRVAGVAAVSGGYSFIHSVSCGTPGNCAAGGEYSNGSKQGAFVVDETNGTWGKAIPVPGLATLSGGGQAVVQSVSCATAGNCAAGGFYFGPGHSYAFVVDETNGSWGNAIDMPGTTTLSGDAAVNSISCGASGTCAAGGFYNDGTDKLQAFIVDETNGSWGNAIEAPGTATLNSGGRAEVSSISCPSAGNCAAAGSYTDGPDYPTGHPHAFVVDETNGSWGNAAEPPGVGVDAEADSISCATAGNCTVAGTAHGAFVADETNGSWGNTIVVPGTASVTGLGVNSVSCGAPGVCVLGGYHDGHGGGSDQVAFVAGSGTRPLTVPSAPHLKSAAPGDTTIRATWSKPADKGGVPIAGYRATAKAGRHVFTCTTKSKLGCTIGGLKNGTTYTVTVVAKNAVGRSKPSNSKKARPRM